MNKLIVIIAVFVFLFTSSGVFAADSIQLTRCFSFYNFTSDYFSSVYVAKYRYTAGDTLNGEVILKNINDYALPDLNVRAYISYVGDTFQDRLEGNDMMDEMWIAQDVNLLPGQASKIPFTWKVPANSKTGMYLISFYLVSSNQFNFGGLSFFPEIAGKTTFFEIANLNPNGLMFFDKNNVTVNGEQYKFRQNVGPFVLPLAVKTKLINNGIGANVNVNYALYSWDDSSESNKIDEKKESFFLGEKQSHDISYTLPTSLEDRVYQLTITAVADDGRKSIIKIRLPMDVQKGRFIFLGLGDFPIQKGDAVVMWCFSNSAYGVYEGRQTVEVQDKSGNVLKSYGYSPVNMSGTVDGAYETFSSGKPLYYVKLIGKIFNGSNDLQQTVEVVYDASKFGLTEPEEVPATLSFNYLVLIPIILVVAVVLAWYWKRR